MLRRKPVNFLLRHFEKIILGAALLALLLCLALFLRNLHETTRLVHDRWDNAIEVPEGDIPAISEEDFNAEALLHAPQLTWSAATEEGKQTLFDPRDYIYCANPDCPYILTYDTKECPHCGAPQGAGDDAPDPNTAEGSDDKDQDGLPAEYEQQYDFLDDRVAGDAQRDHDQDLFTNLEEFKAGTDPDDPSSHPPLARKIRFLDYQKRKLPLELYQVKTYGNADKEQWDLFITVDNDRTKIFSLGDELLHGRYTIAEVTHQTEMVYDKTVKMEREVETGVVTLKDNTSGNQIKLEKGKRPLATNFHVTFVLLDDPESLENSRKFRAKVGDVITLTDTLGNDERYRVRFLSRRNSPALQPLDENGEDVGKSHVIRRFSRDRDLQDRRHQSLDGGIPGRAEDAGPPPFEF